LIFDGQDLSQRPAADYNRAQSWEDRPMAAEREALRDWHRLFGLLLSDFFAGSPFDVELEKDLSLKQQYLDVVILRKRRGRFVGRLPDGFDDLALHNLLTFKSFCEALDDWGVKELTGHYVNYRKQVSPSLKLLLPEEQFRLYAVCSRYPQKLAGAIALTAVQGGVYDCRRGTDAIRIIVAHDLPRTENNAILHLLSASPEQVRVGVEHYEQRSADTSTLLSELFEGYEREGLAMPYTMEDFRRDYVKEHLKDLTPEERLEGLSADELVRRLSPDERLQGLSAEELLRRLSPDQIESYLQRLSKQRPSRRRNKKK
jgi:hypothetical protein